MRSYPCKSQTSRLLFNAFTRKPTLTFQAPARCIRPAIPNVGRSISGVTALSVSNLDVNQDSQSRILPPPIVRPMSELRTFFCTFSIQRLKIPVQGHVQAPRSCPTGWAGDRRALPALTTNRKLLID